VVSGIVREMLISHDPSETRVAVVEDGGLAEYYIERAKRIFERNDPRKLRSGDIRSVIIAQEEVRAGVGASFTVDWATAPGASHAHL